MKRNFKIGLFAIIALVVLFFGIQFLKGINVFKPSNYYQVSYTNVAGLQVSAPVYVNGFKVGQVSEIQYEYNNPGHVLVTLNLEKALKIPAGTKAVIESDILGTATVNLVMGESQDFHNVGDKITGETARGMMDDVSKNIMPGVNRMIPTVDTLLTNVNSLVTNPALEASISRLDNITMTLAATLQSLDKSIAQLPGVMKNVQHITNNLDTVSANLSTLSTQLSDAQIDKTLANVREISAELKELSASLNSDESTVGQLLHDPSLYNNLTEAAASLDSLLIDVKKNPKRYISIKLL